MKFQIGDATDAALCVALKHEFLRCDDAFKDFASSATTMITQGENRRIAYKTYNAYARFIHHLYEFMMGAVARDRQDTSQLTHDWKDRYIASHAQRILSNRREAILNGTAPAWENHISSYPENIPPEFPAQFRRFRNIVSGHVKFERSNLNLSEFYDRYHMYLYMLYRDVEVGGATWETTFPTSSKLPPSLSPLRTLHLRNDSSSHCLRGSTDGAALYPSIFHLTNHVLLPAFWHRSRLTGCKYVALLPFVAVARDAAASCVALASVTRPRLARPKAMEEIMRVLTLNELMRLTRIELCDLMAQMANILRIYPEGSAEREAAITNVRNIARILVNRAMSLG